MGANYVSLFAVLAAVLFCAQLGWCQKANFQKKEKEVLDNILRTYDSRIRPTGNSTSSDSSATVVTVNMYLLSLEKADDSSMDYTVQMYLRQGWNDERFKFNDNGGSLKHLIVENSRKIWTPDLFFANDKEASEHDIVKPNYFIRISPNGDILYSSRLSLRFSCPMNLRWFPFDRHICNIRLESYGWNREGLQLKWKEGRAVDITKEVYLPTFSLEKWETAEKLISLGTGEYSYLELDLYLNRCLNYYLLHIIIPSTMLVLVSWVAFWVDHTAITARVIIAVSSLFTLALHTAASNNKLPPVSYTRSIDVWNGVCLSFVFASLLVTASANYLSRSAEKKRAKGGDKSETPGEDATAIDMKPLVTPAKDETPAKEGNGRSNTLRLRERANEYKTRISKISSCAKRLDVLSRVLFPLLFALFAVLYFLTNWLH